MYWGWYVLTACIKLVCIECVYWGWYVLTACIKLVCINGYALSWNHMVSPLMMHMFQCMYWLFSVECMYKGVCIKLKQVEDAYLGLGVRTGDNDIDEWQQFDHG